MNYSETKELKTLVDKGENIKDSIREMFPRIFLPPTAKFCTEERNMIIKVSDLYVKEYVRPYEEMYKLNVKLKAQLVAQELEKRKVTEKIQERVKERQAFDPITKYKELRDRIDVIAHQLKEKPNLNATYIMRDVNQLNNAILTLDKNLTNTINNCKDMEQTYNNNFDNIKKVLQIIHQKVYGG